MRPLKTWKTILVLTLMLVISLIALLPVNQAGADLGTAVSLSPSSQTVAPGETFEVDVCLALGSESRGAQFDLTFDHNLLICNSVTEGDLFSMGGTQPTYWRQPVIDNRGNGAVIGAACVVVSPSTPVSGSGILASISFTANDTLGTTELDFSKVIVADADCNAVEVVVVDGSVTVGIQGDVNSDGKVNVLDFGRLALHWGETGTQGWIPEDLNNDGVINILDNILIGIHWTG